MIAQLLRREPLSVPAVGFAIALIWAVAHPGGAGFPIAAVLFPILMLFAGNAGRRATLFQAALPIPARSLFAARLAFFLIAVWTPLVTLGVAMLLRPKGAGAAAELLSAGMAVTLAGVVVLTARVEEFDAHVSRLGFFTIALGGLGFAASQSRYALPIALLFGAVAAARLLYIWPRIPAGFQAAPVQPVRARKAAASRPLSNAASLPLLRSAMPRMAVLMLVVAVFQAAIGMWPYAVIVLSGTPGMVRRAMRWVWGMPISRRAILWLSIGPSVACLAGSVIVSAWLQPMRPHLPPISIDDNAASPPEVWHFTRAAAPVTRAPWGEAVEPRAVRLPGLVAYNPYTIRPQSSRAFVEWQHERAIAAIHGTSGSAIDRPLSLRYPAMALTTALILAFAMLVFFAGALREWRPIGRLPKRWQTSLATAAALLAFLPIAVMEGRTIAGGVRMSSSDLVSALALRLSAALPGGGWVVTAVALLIAAAGCLVVDRQFAGIELGHAAEVVLDRLKQ